MKISQLLTIDTIALDIKVNTKEEAIETLASLHQQAGRLLDKQKYIEAIYEREKLSSTGIGEMIAIPHAQSEYVKQAGLAAIVVPEGVEFKSLDGKPAKLLFMIAVNKDGGSEHLEILAKLCQTLMEESIKEKLLHATTKEEFLNVLDGNMQENDIGITNKKDGYDILAVTACPTGIAHTYMAAKALEEEAAKLGYTIKVETNGASGVKNALTNKEIENARCIIVAADKKVEMARFNGKLVIQCPVAKGIHESQKLLEDAYNENAKVYYKEEASISTQEETSGVRTFYKHLMSGVSQIISLLIIGGATSAILTLLGISDPLTVSWSGEANEVTYTLAMVSYLSRYLALILVSGYIAHSISDRQGFVIAILSVALMSGYISFIEAILLGFLCGYLMLGLKKLLGYLPKTLDSIKPNVVLPLIGSLIMITITIIINIYYLDIISVYHQNIVQIVLSINPWLKIVIAMGLGGMMSIDMGGPINKTAYTIGIFFIFMNQGEYMAAVMAGGIVPPLVIALSTTCMKKRFTLEQQKAGLKNYIMASSFVTEEALPFMKSDKKSIYPACLIGATIAAGISMYFNCGTLLPHGGLFVLPFITYPLQYVLAIFIGAIVGTIVVSVLKRT